MQSHYRLKRIKKLKHKDISGEITVLEIPKNLNQENISKIKFSDYSVSIVAVDRELAEAEITTLKLKNTTVGFLIPGQAILSPDSPMNENSYYGPYSLIAAIAACKNSFENNYDLSSPTTNDGTFFTDLFYAVVWIEKLEVSKESFFDLYFACLARSGVYFSPKKEKPLPNNRTLETYSSEIRLTKNKEQRSYVSLITGELSPFTPDPFLRFFYLYQVIESLMTEEYESKYLAIKTKLDSHGTPTITQLHDFLDEFRDISKEKTRILNALQPKCIDSEKSAEKILTELGEDFGKLDFPGKIYCLRNIIFHDFKRIHKLSNEIAELEENLMNYILNIKLI